MRLRIHGTLNACLARTQIGCPSVSADSAASDVPGDRSVWTRVTGPRATVRCDTSVILGDRYVCLSSSTMEANREHHDQARRESESFHKLTFTPPIEHHKSLFVARF